MKQIRSERPKNRPPTQTQSDAKEPSVQPTTTRGQKRLTLRRSRPTLIAAVAIALAVLAAAAPAYGQQPAPSKSTMGVTAKLTTVAEFPVGFFLENVAVRTDGSLLVTELSKKGLWYVP